ARSASCPPSDHPAWKPSARFPVSAAVQALPVPPARPLALPLPNPLPHPQAAHQRAPPLLQPVRRPVRPVLRQDFLLQHLLTGQDLPPQPLPPEQVAPAPQRLPVAAWAQKAQGSPVPPVPVRRLPAAPVAREQAAH